MWKEWSGRVRSVNRRHLQLTPSILDFMHRVHAPSVVSKEKTSNTVQISIHPRLHAMQILSWLVTVRWVPFRFTCTRLAKKNFELEPSHCRLSCIWSGVWSVYARLTSEPQSYGWKSFQLSLHDVDSECLVSLPLYKSEVKSCSCFCKAQKDRFCS